MLVDIYTKDGSVNGQMELDEEIFGIEPNEHAMHIDVVTYLARKRQGTHKAKVRGEVRGGGKKPWRQKGRGTARAGSTRSPIWIGGGTIHGPKPHPYDKKVNKKVRRLAKKSALSSRASEKNILILEDFALENIKTKEIAAVLKNLKIDGQKTILALAKPDKTIFMSGRNIPHLTVQPLESLSTYEILSHKKLVLFKGAVENLINTYKN